MTWKVSGGLCSTFGRSGVNSDVEEMYRIFLLPGTRQRGKMMGLVLSSLPKLQESVGAGFLLIRQQSPSAGAIPDFCGYSLSAPCTRVCHMRPQDLVWLISAGFFQILQVQSIPPALQQHMPGKERSMSVLRGPPETDGLKCRRKLDKRSGRIPCSGAGRSSRNKKEAVRKARGLRWAGHPTFQNRRQLADR